MQRRHLLCAALAGAIPATRAAAQAGTLRLAAAWRGPAADDAQMLGVLEPDFEAGRIAIGWSRPLPGRAHGLLAEPGARVLAVAMRPGTWLLRCDAAGELLAQLDLERDEPGHWLDGHALASADGRLIYTPQTDGQGRGWLAVRDARSLRRLELWPTHGIDPHHLLLHPDGGDIMLANGGVPRDTQGRKRDLDRMASSLVRLDAHDGRLLGKWTLADARLSMRHLAWHRDLGAVRPSGPLLGIALQAEHDDAAARARAPVLALWDGRRIESPDDAAQAAGYAGDICAAPSGFALSAQRSGLGLLWRHHDPQRLQRFAELGDACALAAPAHGSQRGAVLLAAGIGAARWHPSEPPRLLRWPRPMALDNHWVVLEA